MPKAFTPSMMMATAAVFLVLAAVIGIIAIRERAGVYDERLQYTVRCLELTGSQMLILEGGVIYDRGKGIGSYVFQPAVAGKYGPSIHVKGISVRRTDGVVEVTSGAEEWFWRFVDRNTVTIPYYPSNSTTARRCRGSSGDTEPFREHTTEFRRS